MKKVLLVTAGIFHPPFFGRMVLHNTLKQMKGFSFEHISSLEKLPSDLESYAALVLNFHHRIISDSALKKLDGFVQDGGGILAIHGATASFKTTLPYFKILGGRFIGHGKVEKFQVRKLKNDVFDGIGDFEVRDELYIHELEPGIEVHFAANYEGRDVPVVWTYQYDNGNVCYTVPGHTTGSMKNPTYQRILKRGLEWVTE